MHVHRLAVVRTYAVIGAAAVVLATGLLEAQPASAATTSTASADLVTTITPLFQEKTEYYGPYPHFAFTAVVNNNGPNSASNVVVTVSGVITAVPALSGSVAFSISPAENCSTSADTFSCSTIPVGATITAGINITRFCFGHYCSSTVLATATSVTPDPNTANNSETGQWVIVCAYMRNCAP